MVKVITNGLHQAFIRQRDPLAPFLFLLVAEGLSSMMRGAVKLGKFAGFKFDHSPEISHLQYANDTLFVWKALFHYLWAPKAILRSFEMVSDLKVNFHKSCL